MPATFLSIPKDEWTQLNIASVQGIAQLVYGDIVFTQQTTKPTLPPAINIPDDADVNNYTAPIARLSKSGTQGRYDTVEETGEFIYAYGVRDSLLSIAPVGGVR